MLSWMDEHLMFKHKSLKGRGTGGKDPLETLRGTIYQIQRHTKKFIDFFLETSGPDAARQELMLYKSLEAFSFPLGKELAIQVPSNLALDLWGAEPPQGVDADAILAEHEWVYIDLPGLDFELADRWRLRAIVIGPPGDELYQGDRPLLLVFFQPGRKCDGELLMDYRWETIPGLDSMTVRQEINWQPGKGAESHRKVWVNNHDVWNNIRAFVRLVMLYWKSGASMEEYLPHIEQEEISKTHNPKKLNNKLRERSMFRIQRLASPEGGFGRESDREMPEEGRHWTLDHKVRVRGFFRWQAHGPRHTLRRLQWIPSFTRGPEDGPEKPTLNVLK